MVRVPRYPASPLQEIFLPEATPFVQFDVNKPTATKPPAPLPAPSLAQCEAEKDRFRDIFSMHSRGLVGAEQVREASCALTKCQGRVAVREAIEGTPALQAAQTFTMDLKEAEEDQRYKQLHYGKAPSIMTKYHL